MANAALATAEASAAKAPSTVLSIPSSVRHGNISNTGATEEQHIDTPGALIRGVGTTRRIFVLNPTFTTAELDGLAHRIQMMGRNSGLNSILISNMMEEEENLGLPTMACDYERPYDPYDFVDDITSHQRVPLVSNGCDPQSLANLTRAERKETYQAMSKLALSIRGGKSTDIEDPYHSKIPTVSVAHGSLSDGGYLLAMGSYALATGQTRFEILNPARGLALDPIGLSYILPRCGEEYNQPSRKVPLGKLLALTGFQADGVDLVQSGLFTHFMGSSLRSLGMLESLLSESIPYNQQNLQIEPTKLYGGEMGGLPQPVTGRFQKGRVVDVNAHLRNLAVANIIHNMSEFDAAGQDPISLVAEREMWAEDDPSLVLEHEKVKVYADCESNLLNVAAAFHDVLEEETTVEGVLERMREYAAMDVEGKDEEEVEFVETAKKLVEGMESRSPLALSVVWELLQAGGADRESLQSCMEREEKCQLNLLEHDDFRRWIESGEDEEDFKDWTHSSLKHVTADEVKEIMGQTE